jgi:hypothetical protein
MNRTLSLATALAAVIALPAMAEDAKTGTEPGAGATSTMSDQVPQMKSDAETVDAAQPNTSANDTKQDAGIAANSAQQSTGTTLTTQEALIWIDKPVYSSDGEQVGEVVEFQRDADNKVIGMHADIGGFLGFGETRVNLMPAQFELQGDRIVLNLTAEQARALPKVQI